MAKIIYKEGCEGQNKLSSIEGIEIDLFNGQKALIYPKYAKRRMLEEEHLSELNAANEKEIEALKVEDTNDKTDALLKIGSPAAKWVSKFRSDKHGKFNLSSLIAALETQQQEEEIDALAETIEGADLLRRFTFRIWSCSRYVDELCWYADLRYGCADYAGMLNPCLVVPTILYR